MIWCVEDDASIRDIEIYALNSAGFETKGFEDGTSCWEALKTERPDLILLDVMLPGIDGIEILTKMKAHSDLSSIPVIMATAKGQEYDRIKGLDLGADDYIVKPFSILEMVSRVKAVLRRIQPKESVKVLVEGGLIVNLDEHTVAVDGKRVTLTYKEFELLSMFMSHPGMVYTREQLFSQVWKADYMAFDITEQANAEKHRREFTANVSHELKTPLQTIIGSAELIETGIVKKEDVPRFMGHIRKEASRLVSLIDDIIGLSQLDEGGEMPREEVSLKAIAEEVCEVLADAAERKNIALENDGEDVVITGVRRLLYEIMYNLGENAIKYNHPEGFVKIKISQDEEKAYISVQDTGIGIAPEDQNKIFERFYRVDKSHSKQSGGTGLGLSIVKHAVQYHNGEIVVDSKINCGTTITVALAKNG